MQIRSMLAVAAFTLVFAGCVSSDTMVMNVAGAARPVAYTADTVWRPVSSGQVIIEQPLQPVSVVQLSAPLNVPNGKIMSHQYSTDDVLFEMSNVPAGWKIFCGVRGDIYSGVLKGGSRAAAQSCLVDVGADGAFDRVYSLGRGDEKPTLLTGGIMVGGLPLPAPVSYVPRTDGDMPRMRAGVRYTVAPGSQNRWLTYVVDSRGEFVDYTPTAVKAPALSPEPALVEVFGAKVELREVTPGNVEYRVYSALPPGAVVQMLDLQ